MSFCQNCGRPLTESNPSVRSALPPLLPPLLLPPPLSLPAVDADVARVISPEAKAALTYLCLTIYGYGFGIFATFYGTAAVVRGYLILRSGYLPHGLGAILILGGASFIAKNFLVVLAPQYDLPYVIVPMFLAMVSLTLWLLIKGVDRARWDARMDRVLAGRNSG
jgi:Domain of unknown function (DUF4386)